MNTTAMKIICIVVGMIMICFVDSSVIFGFIGAALLFSAVAIDKIEIDAKRNNNINKP